MTWRLPTSLARARSTSSKKKPCLCCIPVPFLRESPPIPAAAPRRRVFLSHLLLQYGYLAYAGEGAVTAAGLAAAALRLESWSLLLAARRGAAALAASRLGEVALGAEVGRRRTAPTPDFDSVFLANWPGRGFGGG